MRITMRAGLRRRRIKADEPGLRTKRCCHAEEFFGFATAIGDSIYFASGYERVIILPGQKLYFRQALQLGQMYCLKFFPGGTRLQEISHMEQGVIWSA